MTEPANESNVDVIGVNLGAGIKWQKENWLPLDVVNGEMLDGNTILPFDDATLAFVFSDNFFEHVTDDVLQHLLQESCRVLKPDGVIRIIVPDFPYMYQRYKAGDLAYFTDFIGFRGRKEWPKHNVEASLENIFLHWLSNYDSHDDGSHEDFYRGPPKNLLPEEVKSKSKQLDVLEFSRWVVSNVPRNRFKPPHGHINCFTFDKLAIMLQEAGFKQVFPASYGSSIAPYFEQDILDNPIRKKFSMFVEARK